MQSGRGSAEREPTSVRCSASPLRFRLTLMYGMNLLLVALLVGLWVLSPTTLESFLPHGIASFLNPGVRSHNLTLKAFGAVMPTTQNPIVAENANPGTDSWRQNLPYGPVNAISAYPVPASVNIGQAVKLYVTTTAASYTFSVYRVGWYQGHGARLLYTSPRIKGINQPAPIIDSVTRMLSDANWRDPVTLQIPISWVSGVYIVKFVTADNVMRYTFFVVRNDASHAPLLFQMPLATYQAYNDYGGRSLYGEDEHGQYNRVQRAYAVTFDRPYAGTGLFLLPRFEGPLILFLEKNGYDMSYMSDMDLLLHPQSLMQHKLLIAGGHDEYWSAGMRQAVTAARDHGVSLAFFNGNAMYWQIRLAASPLGQDRVVICYRYPSVDPLTGSDPALVTTNWANPPVSMPQNSLLGEMYSGIPIQSSPLVLMRGAQPYLTGTRLQPGDALPNLISGEIDTYIQNGFQPSHVIILAASPAFIHDGSHVKVQISDATIYTAPSGAMVFDSGTFGWTAGLDTPWPGTTIPARSTDHGYNLAQFTINLLNQMINHERQSPQSHIPHTS